MGKKNEKQSGLSENWITIFRAGDFEEFGQGNWPADKLEQIAANFDPGYHEPPLVLDHETGPSYGYVSALRRVGDRLQAKFRDVSEQLRDAWNRRAFSKISASFYRDLNGKGPALRHVGILGAQIPQVKGLPLPANFAEGGEDTADFHVSFSESGVATVEPADVRTEAERFADEVVELVAKASALQRKIEKHEQRAAASAGVSGGAPAAQSAESRTADFSEEEQRDLDFYMQEFRRRNGLENTEPKRKKKAVINMSEKKQQPKRKPAAKSSGGTVQFAESRASRGQVYDANRDYFERAGIPRGVVENCGRIPVSLVKAANFAEGGEGGEDFTVFSELADVARELKAGFYEKHRHEFHNVSKEDFIKHGSIPESAGERKKAYNFSEADKRRYYQHHKKIFQEHGGITEDQFVKYGSIRSAEWEKAFGDEMPGTGVASFSESRLAKAKRAFYRAHKDKDWARDISEEDWVRFSPQDEHDPNLQPYLD